MSPTRNVPIPAPKRAYAVGYARPPIEHQFRKGKSGNPSGRPAKPKSRLPVAEILQGADEQVKDWILEEAYRPVTIREGDRIIELPTIRAVLRSMSVSALKGNRFSQRTLTELVQRTEDERRELQFSLFTKAMDYKDHWAAEFARCDALGLPRPEPVPHPDDVIVEPRRGAARIAGPMTVDDKKAWDRALEFRDELIEEMVWFRRSLRTGGTPEHIEELCQTNTTHIDRINAVLPDRYRKRYEDAYDDSGRKRRSIQNNA